jgi:cobalt-zinc-cadmium efflux system protein
MSTCDHHHHGHDHGHHHAPANYDRAFAIGVGLNLAFVGVELIFGLVSNSLALVADAGHNFSDVFSLVLAWGALWLSRQRPSKRRTYGFGRSTIMASLINAVVLLIAVGAIIWGALGRLIHPLPIDTGLVIWVALIGIVINGATAAMFMRGSKDDINIRGAYLHMAADAGISFGVVIAGLIIGISGWLWIDPVTSILIAVIIAFGTFGLLRDSVNLTLDAVPRHINSGEIEDYLCGLPGVTAVHDLHIWSISTTSVALTAHLVRPDMAADDDWLYKVSEDLQQRFKIDHTTLQIETGKGGSACKLESEEVV